LRFAQDISVRENAMSLPRRAFTLVELLIVIAIIAILVAILFPVFGRARESARQTACMQNMHDIYVAASLYKLDNNKYPCLLLGYAERQPDHLPWIAGEKQSVVPADQIQHGFLYKTYIKNIETFHCPDNPTSDPRKLSDADYPDASPIAKALQSMNSGHG
jgi:prepilin-type N-terminal cleavage/methylation domain-containing protein